MALLLAFTPAGLIGLALLLLTTPRELHDGPSTRQGWLLAAFMVSLLGAGAVLPFLA